MIQAKLFILAGLLTLSTLGACQSSSHEKHKAEASMQYKVVKSEAEWRKELTPAEFNVLREKGTERAFSGEYNEFKEKGVFACAACGQELFSSETKFDSGTGWPSFYKPISKEAVAEEVDKEYGMVRTEVLCSNCGGHLGHVFNDGPKPTGLRYCLNSVALDFVAKK